MVVVQCPICHLVLFALSYLDAASVSYTRRCCSNPTTLAVRSECSVHTVIWQISRKSSSSRSSPSERTLAAWSWTNNSISMVGLVVPSVVLEAPQLSMLINPLNLPTPSSVVSTQLGFSASTLTQPGGVRLNVPADQVHPELRFCMYWLEFLEKSKP